MSVYKSPNLINFGCLHPVKTWVNGNYIDVPCRHCSYCLNKRGLTESYLTSLELLGSKATSFVTLTYRNSDIPKVNYLHDFPFTDFYNSDGEVLYTAFSKPSDVKLLRKISLNYANRFPRYFKFGQIPVVSIDHVQNFVKAVSERCYRAFGSRLRYCYCCEYGESFFRPHYHVLFFCPSFEVRSFINQIVHETWHYGHCYSVNFHGCKCDYLSSYLNASSSLLNIYQKGIFRPRFRHSQRFGFDAFKQTECFEKLQKGIPLISDFNDLHVVKSFYTPSVYQKYVFPRCRGFFGCSFNELIKRYKLADYYAGEIACLSDSSPSLSDITKFIFNEVLTKRNLSSDTFSYYASIFGIQKVLSLDDSKRLFNQIYSDVLTSSNFVKASRLYSNSNFFIHLHKTVFYYQHLQLLISQHDLDSITSLGADVGKYYFLCGHDSPSLSDFDYKKSRFYSDWVVYNDSLLYDRSKLKKLKEKFTLKSYD